MSRLPLHKSCTRRRFLLVLTTLLPGYILMFGAQAEARAADERPNILFVFTDDHAAQALRAYGSRYAGIHHTPNFNRLAREGMVFKNCFVTNSICGPSRAVILTGKHSHLNGITRNGQTFDGSQQTFPKLLQQSGYQTAIVGKWHLRSDPTGFDYWEVLYGQGPYYNPPLNRMGERTKYTGYTTDIITDRALNWLKNGRDQDEPFMLMYQHKAPHRRWEPGPDYLTRYDGQTMPEPFNLFDDYENRGRAAAEQDMTIAETMNRRDLKLVPPGNLTDAQLEKWNAAYKPKNEAFREADLQGKALVRWKYQRYIKDYLRCIEAVDENLGRVLDYLDESGLAENTVVVYTSDQGFYLGEHGWFDKRFMYEESLRAPLLVRWPGMVEPGSVNTDLVQNLDFAETFLDIAGVEIPDDMQGRSLVPLLEGETPDDWRESIYYHYYEYPAVHSAKRHYGVRTGRYKLIHFYHDVDEWELYDLLRDPHEMRNVYDDPDYAEVVQDLQSEIRRLQERYEVPEAHTRGPDRDSG